MKYSKTNILFLIIFLTIPFSCAEKSIKDKRIIPFLEEISDTIDILNLTKIVNLTARNINDSSFIIITPINCVDDNEIQYFFNFSDKLFLFSGDIEIINKIININFNNSSVTYKKNHKWKFCSEIKQPEIYDPPYIIVLVSKNAIEKVKVSQEREGQIFFGNSFPPPPSPPESQD